MTYGKTIWLACFSLWVVGNQTGESRQRADDPATDWKSPALRITLDEFQRLHAKDAIVTIDVRDTESYRTGHIPGAVLIPLDTVEKRIAEVRTFKKPIVTYCS